MVHVLSQFVMSAYTPWHHCNNPHLKSMYCILTVHNRYTQYRGVILVPDLARQQILVRSPWLVWFNLLCKTAHIFPEMPQPYSPHTSWTEKESLVLTKDALWFCTLLQKCVLPSLPLMHWIGASTVGVSFHFIPYTRQSSPFKSIKAGVQVHTLGE